LNLQGLKQSKLNSKDKRPSRIIWTVFCFRIRSMLCEIRLSPIGGVLEIELIGELAGLLSLGQKETVSKRYAAGRSFPTWLRE